MAKHKASAAAATKTPTLSNYPTGDSEDARSREQPSPTPTSHSRFVTYSISGLLSKHSGDVHDSDSSDVAAIGCLQLHPTPHSDFSFSSRSWKTNPCFLNHSHSYVASSPHSYEHVAQTGTLRHLRVQQLPQQRLQLRRRLRHVGELRVILVVLRAVHETRGGNDAAEKAEVVERNAQRPHIF